MEKDALLEIIIHDLKEVEMLAQNVKGETQLSKAFFKLTRNRINSILEEIEMLEELSSPEIRLAETKTVKTAQKASPAPDFLPKEESKQKDLTPPTTPEPEEPAPENLHVNEPLHEKEIPSVPDKTTETEEKKEPATSQKPEEKEKNRPVDKEKQAVPEQSSEKKEEKEKRVLGEKLVKGKDSFNEQIGKNQKTGNSKRSFSAPPITDLKKAMGINDRFFFQRELFGGSAEVMNQTLEQLNQLQGINEAQDFLLANFNWDPENEALLSFMELVERRYL